jgi:hypothetical protein
MKLENEDNIEKTNVVQFPAQRGLIGEHTQDSELGDPLEELLNEFADFEEDEEELEGNLESYIKMSPEVANEQAYKDIIKESQERIDFYLSELNAYLK